MAAAGKKPKCILADCSWSYVANASDLQSLNVHCATPFIDSRSSIKSVQPKMRNYRVWLFLQPSPLSVSHWNYWSKQSHPFECNGFYHVTDTLQWLWRRRLCSCPDALKEKGAGREWSGRACTHCSSCDKIQIYEYWVFLLLVPMKRSTLCG